MTTKEKQRDRARRQKIAAKWLNEHYDMKYAATWCIQDEKVKSLARIIK